MTTKEWRSLIQMLRVNFPITNGCVSLPVRVRRTLKRTAGSSDRNKYGYTININPNQPDEGLVDSLLHEWAHVFAINEAYYNHAGQWAEIHGKMYQLWEKENR